ncbi:hypothetical protein B7463_g1440, partial [Scytalidium lignicola]
MDVVKAKFPKGLPTLQELQTYNEGADVPPETAWIWGMDDEIGRINLLTPERVAAARTAELRDGDVVSLNWNMNLPKRPAFGRQPCKHRIANHPDSPWVFDDWLDMNIQSGSQWDGFRHYGHLSTGRLYNNLTREEVLSGTRCGIQAISEHGIVGRGVLLDYYAWTRRHGKDYEPFSHHSITLENLKQVAKEQGIEFQVGDILLIRSGYTARYYELEKSDPQRLHEAGSFKPFLAGVEQTEGMKSWLHDQYFAAVAGDAPAFECWPPKTPESLHEYLLGLWGVPIGEMFDLEALAKQCEEKKRWTFFFTSSPFNMPAPPITTTNPESLECANDAYLHRTVQSLFSLSGRVVVITGGARGIGLAFGVAVAEAGGDVAVLDVLDTPHPHFETLKTAYGVRVKLYKTDVTDFETLKATFEQVVRDFGRIDGCIAAAGICPDEPFLSRTPDSVSRCFSINVLGVYFTAQLAAAQMISQAPSTTNPKGGSIILVGSVAAYQASKAQYLSDYCASKGAVLSLARELAVELADRGVRVNTISPGYMMTDMTLAISDTRPGLAQIFVNEPPMRRMGDRSDLKGACVYLLSDASAYHTGDDMLITGGLHAGRTGEE